MPSLKLWLCTYHQHASEEASTRLLHRRSCIQIPSSNHIVLRRRRFNHKAECRRSNGRLSGRVVHLRGDSWETCVAEDWRTRDARTRHLTVALCCNYKAGAFKRLLKQPLSPDKPAGLPLHADISSIHNCQHLPLGKFLIVFKGHVPNTKPPPTQKGQKCERRRGRGHFTTSNIHLSAASVIFGACVRLLRRPSLHLAANDKDSNDCDLNDCEVNVFNDFMRKKIKWKRSWRWSSS